MFYHHGREGIEDMSYDRDTSPLSERYARLLDFIYCTSDYWREGIS